MSFQLKDGQENFEVVDGPDAGKKFERGREYPSVPKGEARRFKKVKKPTTKKDKEA